MPSIQLERKAESIRGYLAHVQKPDLSEYARGVAFTQLLSDLLLEAEPQFLQDYLKGMEHSLSGPKTGLYNRGRPDALYGNLVIEFKRNLSKSLEDAKEQLKKYLALLLSSALDAELKPLQARGDFGPRHIHKKMWAFPIPLYNGEIGTHERLAHLGRECSEIAQSYLDSLPAKIREGSLGRLRNMIREKLKDHISDIDTIVKDILQ